MLSALQDGEWRLLPSTCLDSGPRTLCPQGQPGGVGGDPLSLKSHYQTQLSASGLLSLEALHLPQPRGGVRMGLDGRETGF